METNPLMQSPSDSLESRFEKSRKAWKRLGMAIGSTTPNALGRAILVLGALAGLVWLAVASWPALLPFIVGGVIAYIVLPLVDFLDRLMPRILAALLGVLLVLCGIRALLCAIVPHLINQTVALLQRIPPETTLTDLRDQLILGVQFLPPNLEAMVVDAITTTTARLQDTIREIVPSLFRPTSILRALNAIGFILGLVVLPTWLLTVLKDKPRARRALGAVLSGGVRADIWAVLRIFDRAFGTFFRGQVLVGIAVGLATYLGLKLLTRFGAPDTPYLITFAVLAGLLQLIPEVGPLINIVLVVFIAYRISGALAIYVLVLYLGIQFLVGRLVKNRIEERIIDVNPALLVLFIVALSQLGFFWLFIAAPIAGAARDLFRYAFDRLSEPPRPAGLLPGESLPKRAYRSSVSPSRRRVPMIYRRMQTPPRQN